MVAGQTEKVANKKAKKSRSGKPVKRVQKMRPAFNKLEIIGLVKRGHSKAYVSRKSGVVESTIRGWMKAEDKIRRTLEALTSVPSTSYATSPIPSTSTGTNTISMSSTGRGISTIPIPSTSGCSSSSNRNGTTTNVVNQLPGIYWKRCCRRRCQGAPKPPELHQHLEYKLVYTTARSLCDGWKRPAINCTIQDRTN